MSDGETDLTVLAPASTSTGGKVISFENNSGQIQIRNDATVAADEVAVVAAEDILGDSPVLVPGEYVEFEIVRTDEEWRAKKVQRTSLVASAAHLSHCFVVMPYGHTSDEVRWFRGW